MLLLHLQRATSRNDLQSDVQAVAYVLAERARSLMQPDKKGASVNPSTRALGCIVEAALVSVPTNLIEAIIHKGLHSQEAVSWRAAMGCDLFSDKVRSVMMQLHDARAIAGESLIKARSPRLPYLE